MATFGNIRSPNKYQQVNILENYQNSDGSVDVPEALQSYLQGLKKITC